jgi:hypothetical protein
MTSIDGQLNWDRERGFVALGRAHARERDPALATIAQIRAFSLLVCVDVKLANELVELTLLPYASPPISPISIQVTWVG